MLTLLLVIGLILFGLWALGLITRRTMGGGGSCIGCYRSRSRSALVDTCDLLATALGIDFLPFALSLSKGER